MADQKSLSTDLPHYSAELSAPKYTIEAPLQAQTLTLDATGTQILNLPLTSSSPIYTLSASLLNVSSTASIHLLRPSDTDTDTPTRLYALGEHYMSPLAPTSFRDLSAARSHGLLVTLGAREIIWDFSTRIPLPAGSPNISNTSYPTDPVYSIGTSSGPGTRKKSLLILREGRWTRGNEGDEKEEVVALEREGSVGGESKGMPVLSIVEGLDAEWRDFLVACWAVSLWGTLKGRVRRASRG